MFLCFRSIVAAEAPFSSKMESVCDESPVVVLKRELHRNFQAPPKEEKLA